MKVFFIHIPKTGGITIKDILYKYNYNYSELEMKKNRKEITDNRLFLKPKYLTHFHIPFSFYKKDLQLKIKNECILFAIVRNPYERFISSFKFWSEKMSVSKNKRHKDIFYQNFKDCPYLKEVNKENLNLFIAYILNPNFKLTDGDCHFIPMHYYTHNKKVIKNKSKRKKSYFNKKDYIQTCHHILRFETLNEDFNKLIHTLKLDIPLDIVKKINLNITSKDKISVLDLSDTSKKLIQTFYDIDFKLFNYKI